VAECAAVAVADEGGGPARLVIFAVPRGAAMDAEHLREELRELLRRQLNPLFQIAEVRWIDALPRTASNKVMRRTLRRRSL
jgi:acetyl-CoA synthetase